MDRIPIPSQYDWRGGFTPSKNAFDIAPYQESGYKAALRAVARARRDAQKQGIDLGIPGEGSTADALKAQMGSGSLVGRYLSSGGLGNAAQGLGSVPRGANFGTAFLAAAGGAGRAYQAGQVQRAAAAAEAEKLRSENDYRATTSAREQGQADETARHNRFEETKPAPEQGGELGFMLRNPAAADLYRKLHPPPRATGEAPVKMSEEALNQAADIYETTGQMSGYGMGANADRTAVRNRGALRHPGSDIAANKVEYAKNQKTITATQNLRDLSGAWENTVIANGKVMMEAMRGIPEAGNMPMNWFLRHGETLLGSPKMAAFNTARETFKNEVTRLLAQPGGSGGQVVSDAARREVERISSGNLTGRQMQAAFGIIQRDAQNKRVGYDREIQLIRSRIKSRFGVSPDLNLNQPPEAEPQSFIYNPETGVMDPAQ